MTGRTDKHLQATARAEDTAEPPVPALRAAADPSGDSPALGAVEETAAAPTRAGAQRGLLLAVLCTAQFVAVLDVNALIVALPLIGRDLDLAGGGLQWVVTGYVVVYAGCLLAAGRVADAFGRRRVFLAGLATFTAASLACAVAPDSATLIGARGLQGLGAAMLAPAALALLPKDGVAVWTATAAVGGASGLMFGGLLAGSLGWRSVFVINVPIGLATLALAPRVLRGAPEQPSAPGTSGRQGEPVATARGRHAVPEQPGATAGLLGRRIARPGDRTTRDAATASRTADSNAALEPAAAGTSDAARTTHPPGPSDAAVTNHAASTNHAAAPSHADGPSDAAVTNDAAGTNDAAPPTHASARKPLDLRGAALSILGLAALVYALAEHRWLLVIPALIPLASVLKRPKRPAVAGAFLTAALLTAATSGGGVLATLKLQTHLGPFAAGLHLLPLSLSVITGSLIAGRTRIPISAGLALVALGSALAPLSLTAWAVLAGLGLGSASVTATALGMDGAEDPGGTAGLLGTAAQVGTAIGVATLVSIPGSGYAAAAAVTAAGAGLALWRPRAVARRLGSAPH